MSDARNERRLSLLTLVRDELARTGADRRLFMEQLFDVLLVAMTSPGRSSYTERLGARPLDRRIANTLAALHQRLGERWTIAKMAKLAGMSRAAFTRRFAEMTGQSPSRYLARRRIDHACALLVETDDAAGTIALHVGYRSMYAFSRAFKRMVGVPPIVYRRSGRLANSDAPSAATCLRLAA